LRRALSLALSHRHCHWHLSQPVGSPFVQTHIHTYTRTTTKHALLALTNQTNRHRIHISTQGGTHCQAVSRSQNTQDTHLGHWAHNTTQHTQHNMLAYGAHPPFPQAGNILTAETVNLPQRYHGGPGFAMRPIVHAITLNNLDYVKECVSLGAHLGQSQNYSFQTTTPWGMPVNVHDARPYSSLYYATESPTIDILEYLCSLPTIQFDESAVAHTCVHLKNDQELVIRMLRLLIDLHARNSAEAVENGQDPLPSIARLVCKNRDSPLLSYGTLRYAGVRKLLVEELGFDPNARDVSYGRSVLYHAAMHGVEPVKYFVEECKVDPRQPSGDKNNCYPIAYACLNGQLPVVAYLVKEHGCDLNIKDRHGTPAIFGLMRSQNSTSLKSFDLLKELFKVSNIDLSLTDDEGNNIFHYIATLGFSRHWPAAASRILPLLLEYKADPNALNKQGEFPLHTACSRQYYDMAKFLLDCGCDPNVVDHRLRTPLIDALNASRDDHRLVQLLVDQKDIRIDSTDFKDRSSIDIAVAMNKPRCASILFAKQGVAFDPCLSGHRRLFLRACQVGAVSLAMSMVGSIRTMSLENRDNSNAFFRQLRMQMCQGLSLAIASDAHAIVAVMLLYGIRVSPHGCAGVRSKDMIRVLMCGDRSQLSNDAVSNLQTMCAQREYGDMPTRGRLVYPKSIVAQLYIPFLLGIARVRTTDTALNRCGRHALFHTELVAEIFSFAHSTVRRLRTQIQYINDTDGVTRLFELNEAEAEAVKAAKAAKAEAEAEAEAARIEATLKQTDECVC
jgi:ankyrin repeat protein